MTMNDTWGYKSYDNNWKSTTTIVRNLIDIASKGGNYLLNVGPTSEGLIPDSSVVRLKEVGQVAQSKWRGNLWYFAQPVSLSEMGTLYRARVRRSISVYSNGQRTVN